MRNLSYFDCMQQETNASQFPVNVFLGCYLATAFTWLFPNLGGPVWQAVRGAVKYCGFWQGYQIFSPPGTVNASLEAIVHFNDGTTTVWHYPEVHPVSLENVRNFRYRKYGLQYLVSDRFVFLRADFCRYVARIHNTEQRHPVSIELFEQSAAIPPPALGFGQSPPTPFISRTLAYYHIEDTDLL